jgi:hypothetical protein
MAGGNIRGFIRTTAASRARARFRGLCIAPVGGAFEAAVCPSPGKRVSEH